MASSSDARQRGFVPPQKPPEQMLMRRVEELCRRAVYTGRVCWTDFLSDRQQQLAQAAVNRAGMGVCRWEGGYPDAERRVLGILPEDAPWLEDEPAPVRCIRLQVRSAQGKLAHRDCLGAVLGLGLDRRSLGDILPDQEGGAYLFCLPPADALILQQLRQVGRETVEPSLAEEGLPEAADSRARRIQTASLASLRLDAALAAMLHCSREEAAQLVRTGKVQANHLEMTSPHAAIYEGDIFTIRGKGRFRLESIGGKSRRDRIFIQYYQYE